MIKALTEQAREHSGLNEKIQSLKGAACAFAPYTDHDETIGIALTIANSPGYLSIPTIWCHATSYDEMCDYCNTLNYEMFNIDSEQASKIVFSTMPPDDATIEIS